MKDHYFQMFQLHTAIFHQQIDRFDGQDRYKMTLLNYIIAIMHYASLRTQ